MTPEELWRLRTDDEVVSAFRVLEDYTEEGQRVLRNEMQRRGIDPARFPSCGDGNPLDSVLSDARMRRALAQFPYTIRWVLHQTLRVGAPMLALAACAVILDEIHVNSLPLADSPASLQRPLTAVFFTLVLFGFVLLGSRRGWRHKTLWVVFGGLAAVHASAWTVVLTAVETSRNLWFFPSLVLGEYVVFMLMLRLSHRGSLIGSVWRARVASAVLLALAFVPVVTKALGQAYGAPRLRVELVERHTSIGIPGISKVYEAIVWNDGYLPVPMTVCESLSDTFLFDSRDAWTVEVSYAVERWDEAREVWAPIFVAAPEHCRQTPLSTFWAWPARRWLWPSQSVSTGWEATAARQGFSLGDKARFVVFLGEAGDYRQVLATEPSLIDQRPTVEGVSFRITH
jgi:hypothetical protein